MSPTRTSWPPDENSLLKCNTNIPNSLYELVKNVIVHEKSKLTEKKKALIESLCQDLIYSSTGGKYRTKKHVYLSLCVKRKTGSKAVIRWLNQLGHGISYDEVYVSI